MVKQGEEKNALCCADDLAKAKRSYQQLLFLHGISSTKGFVKEEKQFFKYPDTPSAILPHEGLPVPGALTSVSF